MVIQTGGGQNDTGELAHPNIFEENLVREILSRLPNFFRESSRPVISELEKLKWLRSQIIGHGVEFPTPFGSRILTYADHTASGRSLHFVENFILQMILPAYGNTHTEDSFVGRTTAHAVTEAQRYLKECVGGTDDEAILFCGTGCTAAIKRLQEVMAITVPSTLRKQTLRTIKKSERWVVFLGPYEHHSNLLTWRQSLAEVVEIPLGEDGMVDLGELQAALQLYKDRNKLGCFSACSNVTGVLTDTRRIARLLHAHGAFACFDFAACAPYVKVDMRSGRADGYDAIFISPHKFMGGPGTPGILVMSKRLYCLGQSAPSTSGGGIVDYVNFDEQNTLYYDDIELREDAGTPPIVQKIRAALTFSVKELMTTEFIESREAYFIEHAMARLTKNNRIQIYGPLAVKRIAVVSFGVHPALNESPEDDDSDAEFEDWMDEADLGRPQFSPGPPARSLHQWMKSPIRSSTSPVPPKSPTARKSFVDVSSIKRYFSNSNSSNSAEHGKAMTWSAKPAAKMSRSGASKPLHPRFVVTLLNDLFGIQARGGCSCAAPYGHRLLGITMEQSLAIRSGIEKGYIALKPGWARVSFGYYLSKEEFEFILSAIEFIADFGVLFLPLYRLDWNTGDWSLNVSGSGHNQKVQSMITDSVTKHYQTDSATSPWARLNSETSPLSPLSGLGLSSPFSLPSQTTEDYNLKLEEYLTLARNMAERLEVPPESKSFKRAVPHDLFPGLIGFRI